MKIDKPSVATGVVYVHSVGDDVWSVLECVADDLNSYNDEPTCAEWGKNYKITVTVEEM